MTKKVGNLVQIWEEKRKVKIGEEWFTLTDNIKLNYVKKGLVEYTLDATNPKLIVFVKTTSEQQEEPPQEEYPENTEIETKKIFDVKNQKFTKDNYWDWKREFDVKNQREIKSEFCIRESLKQIEINNKISEEKIIPTRENIRSHACIIWDLIDGLAEGGI